MFVSDNYLKAIRSFFPNFWACFWTFSDPTTN